jgi:Fe-S cluster biogenesis protein NfuA
VTADPGAPRELERRLRRLDALVRELEALPDERARRASAEAVRAPLNVHREALERLLDLAGPEATARAAGDPEVAGLLLLHGLHPVPLEQRVRRALEGVRPYLASHGCGVRVLGVGDDVVRVRLERSRHGCRSSAATLRLAVERAVADAAPDVAAIEVAEAPEPGPASGFVPLASIGGPGSATGAGGTRRPGVPKGVP